MLFALLWLCAGISAGARAAAGSLCFILFLVAERPGLPSSASLRCLRGDCLPGRTPSKAHTVLFQRFHPSPCTACFNPTHRPQLKAGEAGRVYVTGVTWQEAEQLWDGGMQRLGPTLVALYATRTPPPGAARVDSAAGAGEMGGRGATGERPPKRPRRGPGGAAAGAPGAQQQQRAQAPRVRAGASARGAVAAGAGAGRAPPSGVPGAAGSSAPAVEQKSRQAPQPDGIHASGEHGAEAGSAGVTMSQVTLSHMEKGGALLLEIGQALELTGTQRMAAVRAVYALSKDQVKLGLLLCMGLPHIKAEVDAGRKEEARSALKELLPEVGL